ncbi:MAG: mucoidy inhibitor MuiA family protein [Flavobacteriales bacterium]|nr:mucoidy inhibitor MuiA family protein [Flavobacteriales bacterium]
MNARALFLTLSLSHLLTLSLQAKEQPVTSKVTGAKVFLSGAQIARSASATITTGNTTLIFTGLSEQLDPMSIQVNGKGGFSILSVNHRINYLTESPKKKEIDDLQTQIKKLEKDWAYEKAMQDVWVNEEQLLNKNSSIGGAQNGLTAAQLTAVNDYVRERLKVTKTNWLAQQEKLTEIGREADKLRAQLAQYQGEQHRPTSEIVVEIDAPVEVAATFTLNYFVSDAGWTPAYDLRAKSTSTPIELLMKAQVINNTGEDWTKVDLALSSGNPTLGGNMPMLSAWVLQQPYMLETISGGRKKYRSRMDDEKAMAPAVAYGWSNGDGQRAEDTEALLEVANTVVYNTTTIEFSIDAPFSVPADGLAHTVAVKTHTVPAIYKHFVTPKLDKDAFLYARTTGWEDLNLLPGTANVFFEGTYVGQSYLNLQQTKDTLDVSLGRDKGVVVERVRRKSTNDKAVIGGKRTNTVGFDISVRNTKGSAIDIEVRDQHPLSPQSEIEVKLIESPDAIVNEQTGQLTWNITVEPKATKKLGFSYSVKHPKDMPVMLE